MQQRTPRSARQQGFTIVELMIATVVFSVILLVVTGGVVHFTNAYYEGVNLSTTQNTARSIIDNVTQAIEFSPGAFSSGVTTGGQQYWCFGTVEYVWYALGTQVTSSQHGLVRVPVTSCTNAPVITNGQEMLQTRMHLAVFTIAPVGAAGTVYSVNVKVLYADNNSSGSNSLLCAPTVQPTSCSPATATPLTAANMTNIVALKEMRCRSTDGSQFCATSSLTTLATRRIN